MRLKLLWDHVVVRKVDEETRGRFMLPVGGLKSESHVYGEVISVGPGSRFADGTILELSVAVGDTVMYRKISGEPMVLDGETYVLLREGDLIGILGAAPLIAVAKVALLVERAKLVEDPQLCIWQPRADVWPHVEKVVQPAVRR